MPYVLDYSKSTCANRLADLAKACNIGPKGATNHQLAESFIDRIRAMKQEFNIPKTLEALKQEFNIPKTLEALKQEDIPQIAAAALKEARFTYAVPRYMDKETCEGLIAQMLVV